MNEHFKKEYESGSVSTTDGKPPINFEYGAPGPINPNTGMHTQYWILSENERAKGFIRPVRRIYKHSICGTHTTMGLALAETYAREPKFYGATFCVTCRKHLPVGIHGFFYWVDDYGHSTDEKVGT